MATPRLTPEQIARSPASLPNTLQPSAKGTPLVLSRSLYNRGLLMDGFFSPQLLDGTRLLVQGERVANPDFLSDAEKLGLQQSARPVRNSSDYVL